MNNLIAALTIFALIGSGLMAGTFFAFSTFIMQAFAARPAGEAMNAMKEINVVILRSPFMAIFFGTALACAILLVYSLVYPVSTGSYLVAAASGVYLVTNILVTGMFNVPRNNRLAKTESDDLMAGAVWDEYLESWTRWNHIRTVGGILSAIMFAGSLLY